ncbi:MAG: hypothetical protein U9Q05_10255, partial [Thermodesulfobacteriota bacterium]|nr:hypothetical protein [Thermodesulfobacteriota bacterium]
MKKLLATDSHGHTQTFFSADSAEGKIVAYFGLIPEILWKKLDENRDLQRKTDMPIKQVEIFKNISI